MRNRYLAIPHSFLPSPAGLRIIPSLEAVSHQNRDNSKIQTSATASIQLLSSSLPATLHVTDCTDCCFWSRFRRRHPTYLRLRPPKMQRRILSRQAEYVIDVAGPSLQPQLCRRSMSISLVALLSLMTIWTQKSPNARHSSPTVSGI